MDRRKFLRWSGFISTTPVIGALAACGGSDDEPAAVAPTVPGTLAQGSDWKFPQSVAAGDPRPDSVLLWTRIVPASASASASDVASATATGDFSVRLVVTAADNAGLLGSNSALAGTAALDATVAVQARWDHTVRNRVTGLAPATVYYYQFVAGDVRSKVGRFKTAPALDADVAQLKFAFMSCQDWNSNHWAAFSDMAAQDFDFVVHLGDYIYESFGASAAGTVEARHATLSLPDGTDRGNGERYATTLADYRYLYKTYRTDSRLQAVHERFAMVAIWDDHEFSDDCWMDAETYDNGSYSAAAGGDNQHQPTRRRGANQAWYEFMLADVAFDTDTTGIQTVRVYRDLRFGRLAHLVMTDERLYRSDHVVPEALPAGTGGAALGSIGARYLVPQPLFTALESAKVAAGTAAGDALAGVSMLGASQRAWWQSTLLASPATWKLWGNEVSLLRMGLDGTRAIGTLIALQSVATLAGRIGTAAASTGGNVPLAAAIVAATVAGADAATAASGAQAVASGGAAAGVSAGLTAIQAGLAAQVLAAASATSGAGAQAVAGAQVIAFGFILADVVAHQAASPFVVAAGLSTSLAPYFNRFLVNCDQWDGYNAERKQLMAHLRTHDIRNVVALTGDIHSFFAGTVSDDYDASGGGTPVMVDLVTAGISSSSFFSYLSQASASLSASLATLVFYPLTIPVTGVGSVTVQVNLLDYTLGRAAPTAAQLAEQIRLPLRSALAGAGVAEAALDATTAAVLAALQADAGFTGQLLPLAQQLAGLQSNPWLKLVQTEAQGYAAVTLTPGQLQCEFRQVHQLVAGAAPSLSPIARRTTATVVKDVVAVTVV